MHATRLKAAVDRYIDQDLKPSQLIAALQADDKEYKDEEVNEIFEAIQEAKRPAEPAEAKDELSEVAAKEKPVGPAVPYLVCNIWHGTWKAVNHMINPLTGRRVGIEFEFVKESSPKREKVKVHPDRMEAINATARLHIAGIRVEQVIPVGEEDDWGYEREIIDGIPQ